ncbi:MAG: phosphotransferase [Myxococcales bacterium]|nr:phosphotransferase [Myxococcales bacterium]
MSTMRTLYTNIRAAQTAVRDIGRLRQIAAVLIRHGLGHVVEAWNLQDKAIIGLLVEKRPPEALPTPLFERITLALQDLGPTFVKLGQILSTRPDLIPQELCDQFMTLQDRVAPIRYEEARAVIEAALGAPVEAVFDALDEKPLASASIAQVHTARLKSGEDVVLKVQRPGIAATIDSDLNLLYYVARQIENTLPEAQAFNPTAIAREFERAIRRELDFNFEASNLERFDRNFSGWTTVYIPRVYRAHSSQTLLVMERLHGVKITDAAARGHEMEPIARECIRMLLKQVFEDGFFHGDLHPGNLFVLDDGRIGLIDFGLVGRMNQRMKDQMADLLFAIVTRNFEGVARSFYELSIRTGKVDYPAFEDDVVQLMERYFTSASLAEVDFGEYLRELVAGAVRHNVRIPPDFTMFFKAMMTVEGIGKIVSPDLDLISECRPAIEQLITERYGPERVMRAAVDTLQAFARFGKQFPITAAEFLAQIEDGHLAVGIEYPQLASLEAERHRRTNRAVLAGLAGVFMLCGTLARLDEGVTIFGLPALATACFIIGGGLALRLVLRILRDGRW